MNRTTTIALFAGIFAIAMTTYGLSGVSASPMIMASSVPQTEEQVGMLGHVDYIVRDSNNDIKSYLQSDNIVVDAGKDCAGQLIFGATVGSGVCNQGAAAFQYIAIGNGTQGEAETDTFLASTGATTDYCASQTQTGELARKLVTPTVNVGASDPAGAEVVLDVGTNTFSFSTLNATSGTTITQSGLFNGIGDANTYASYDSTKNDGSCVTFGDETSDWDMFAIQDLSGGGVAVSAGDSLAVKWTITLD